MDKRPHKLFLEGAKELFSLTVRGVEKLKDKYIWTKEEVEEARGYLIYFRDTMKLENRELFHTVFGESGDFFELTPFARGYSARVLSFKTVVEKEIKKWVIKVGFRYALIESNGDPSHVNYTKEYQGYIDILRKTVAKYDSLAHLLPEPQVITFATLAVEGEERQGTTLAIQPFMHVVRPSALKKIITMEQKKQLLTELREFQELSSYAKLVEIKAYLADLPLEFVSLKDVGIIHEVEEDTNTYEGNSQKKALFYSKLAKLPAISDDGGLEITALNGLPGVNSRYFAGPEGKDEDIIEKMKQVLLETPEDNRSAKFIGVNTLAFPTGEFWSTRAEVNLELAREPSMEYVEGFPFRSFLMLPGTQKYFHESELTTNERKEYNHRYKALMKLKEIIIKQMHL